MITVDKEKQTSYSVLSVDDDEEMIGLLHEVVSQLGHASVTAVDLAMLVLPRSMESML
ncbi:MAG: hypothetical protein JRD00_11240 [Deltaproteobacteria bacterium]|nr:hypothetical protein [Deltaproteobacteria bacterium]